MYYQITLAIHVDLAAERVDRVVELREEIHPRDDDPPMLVTDDGLVQCDSNRAIAAVRVPETMP